MEQRVLILCRGIQASGKTTYSKSWVQESPETRVRFCYDDIRNMMGKYWVPTREHMLGPIRETFLNEASEKKYDIIIDNMNLNPKEIEFYRKWTKLRSNYVLVFKDFFDVSLEECIERDKKRENPIGESVITATYNKYKNILK